MTARLSPQKRNRVLPRPYYREMLFRPGPEPAPGIPIGVRSVGRYYLPADYCEISPPKHFIQVFWGEAGRGTIRLQEENRVLAPGCAAVYLPGMSHRLAALEDGWQYRWWTMDGPLAMDALNAMGVVCGLYEAGPAPECDFEALTKAVRTLTYAGERRAGALAYGLLSVLMTQPLCAGVGPVVGMAQGIIHRQWFDPLFGVEQLARQLDMHRSTLSRLFQRELGIPPVAYIARLRAQNALSLLKNSLLPVAEIAARCGFADPNYFSRAIRRHSGLSPLQFRKR